MSTTLSLKFGIDVKHVLVNPTTLDNYTDLSRSLSRKQDPAKAIVPVPQGGSGNADT